MIKLLSLLLFSFITSIIYAKSIALTFDDAPRSANGYLNGQQRAQKLLSSLDKAGVLEVTFFVQTGRINSEGKKRILKYANSGHLIANHTHKHFNFNNTSVELFRGDFLRAHNILENYPNFRKWFRFPTLREGNTLSKRDGFRDTLKDNIYTNAYITVNNYDWYMESIFQRVIKGGKEIDLQKLRQVYVDVLVDSVKYYDDMAKDVLGRSPKHVLLLHENDLAAMFIGDLVNALKKKGWSIISLEEALKDDISKYNTKRILPNNPGRIGEIAKDKKWRGRLWHKACSEKYLEKLFLEKGVYN